MRRHVNDAVLDDGKALGAAVVGDRIAPHRDELPTLSLLIWVSGLYRCAGIPHAVDEHVAGRDMIVLEILRGLRHRADGERRRESDHSSH